MDSILAARIRSAIASRRLLTHPFYARWQRGEVTRDELRAYAGQYRHFEAALPRYLEGIASRLEDVPAREMVLRNLADEAGGATTHVDLFDRFAASLKAPTNAPPTSATRGLLEAYGDLVARGPASGMAAMVAYETQFPEVAEAKSAGLRRDHGLGPEDTLFWDVHVELDGDHAAWGVEALERIGADADEVEAAAGRAAEAWWSFLDERESEASARAVAV